MIRKFNIIYGLYVLVFLFACNDLKDASDSVYNYFLTSTEALNFLSKKGMGVAFGLHGNIFWL